MSGDETYGDSRVEHVKPASINKDAENIVTAVYDSIHKSDGSCNILVLYVRLP
jgi:hypothetical protein